jgi:hypothetical protein
MSLTHGLMDHGGDDDLRVHRGPVAKVGSALTGVSTCGRCGDPELTVMAWKRRGDGGGSHQGLHGPEQWRR